MKRSFIQWVAVSAALIGAVACNDTELAVTNPNSGESDRVLGTPDDAEALIGTYFKRWYSGVFGSTAEMQGMADIMSLMNYSSLANNCLNARTPFSGAANTNTPGNTCRNEQSRLYYYTGEVNRVASTFLSQIKAGNLKLGSPAREARDKAYAEFLRGISIGYAAMMHDSLSVITDEQSGQDQGVLIGYKEAADSAYAAFDRAIQLATAPATGAQGFPLPDTWIPSPTQWSAANFVRLNRSYRARIRANMARTPAERAAVDWTAVIADAQNGFTEDHYITNNTTTGPLNSWRSQYQSFTTWHQMPPFFIGMADVSGSYAAWIAQPLGERGAGGASFFLSTPDLRFPQGATRAAQQADFAITSCSSAGDTCKRYFVNRPSGNDVTSGAGFGWSQYDHVRAYPWRLRGESGQARNGPLIMMPKAELDLLAAEGMYRAGNYSGAAALVNLTRTTNGLPAITAFDQNSPVPGGATNCVPKVPVAPFNVVACGKLWDALKYEKRIETAYTHYAPWYLDGRGWGDIPQDTPLFWAVPYQDLQARGAGLGDLYGTGPGLLENSSAPVGVYGW
jgi:hypothetical protein